MASPDGAAEAAQIPYAQDPSVVGVPASIPYTPTPVGTRYYETQDSTVGVASPFEGHQQRTALWMMDEAHRATDPSDAPTLSEENAGAPGVDELTVKWAEIIYNGNYLQNPAVYDSAAALALRMTVMPGAYVAFNQTSPDVPLAFGIENPDTEPGSRVTTFDEYGVIWPKTGEGEAPPSLTAAAGAVMLDRVLDKNPNHLVCVNGYPGDSRSPEFFTRDLMMKAVPVAGAQRFLYMERAATVEEAIETNFVVEEEGRYHADPIYLVGLKIEEPSAAAVATAEAAHDPEPNAAAEPEKV